MNDPNPVDELMAQREQLLRQLASVGPFMQGTFGENQVTCGNPACRCARGDKHRSHQVTWKEEGMTKSVYVPVARVEEVRGWIANYQRLKELIRQITSVNEQLLRHSSRRRGAMRGGSASRRQHENR